MAKQSGSSKYCLGCRYCLDHLESNECPECGRLFDHSNRSTYALYPYNRIASYLAGIAIFLLIILISSDQIYFSSRGKPSGYRRDADLWHMIILLPLIPTIFLLSVKSLIVKHIAKQARIVAIVVSVSYTHLTLPTIYSV